MKSGIAVAIVLLVALCGQALAANRVYYIGVIEQDWDYAPGVAPARSPTFLESSTSPVRIGAQYVKARYVEYTDATFTTPKAIAPEWEHLRILGPAVRCVVGDTVQVHFKNMLPDGSREVTFHIHALKYATPANEGVQPRIAPGVTHIYNYTVPERSGPGPSDPSSKLYLYHSHVATGRDINVGLIGPLIVIRQGMDSNNDLVPDDVDVQIVTVFQIFDENQSWLIEKSLAKFAGGATPDATNADYIQSNKMHSINGRLYDTVGALNMAQGQRVRWYLASMGDELDLHTAHWHAHTVVEHATRSDVVQMISAVMQETTMIPDSVGTWNFHCHVNSHNSWGMNTKYVVAATPGFPAEPAVTGVVHKYFIAADFVEWDYAPNKPASPNTYTDTVTTAGAERIGSKYWKAMYVEYTDETFATKKTRPADEAHLGIVGPILRGHVGDKFEILFKNNMPAGSACYSMHPHGVFYDKASEGASAPGVCVGETFTYNWWVRAEAGPGPADPSSIFWAYHSHIASNADMNDGLIGGIVIVDKSKDVNNDYRPDDVDKEKFLYWLVFDENNGHFLDFNRQQFIPGATVPNSNAGFQQSNLMNAMNGYVFNNVPGLDDFNLNDDVRWYNFAMGNERDIHTPHWHAHTGLETGGRTDVLEMLPSKFTVFDMKMTNPGNWNIHCHVNNHNGAGMNSKYVVSGGSGANQFPPQTPRKTWKYYIALERVDWNYYPSDGGSGTFWTQTSTDPNAPRVGSTYKKVQYVRYMDATFTQKWPIPDSDKHLALMGPFIRAAVGDLIEIQFKNDLPLGDKSYSMHPHGVFYEVTSEGVGNPAGGIPPQTEWTYQWFVPESAGPGPKDASSVMWLYHSHIKSTADTESGAVGPMIITNNDANQDGVDDSVDREIFQLYHVFDENLSHYLQESVDAFIPRVTVDFANTDFRNSNEMHSINGRMYNTLTNMDLCRGRLTRWYTASMGQEPNDPHSVHWHANTGLEFGVRKDVVFMLPAGMHEIDMVADNPGTWNSHCHVNTHNSAGMNQKYTVNECTAVTPPPPAPGPNVPVPAPNPNPGPVSPISVSPVSPVSPNSPSPNSPTPSPKTIYTLSSILNRGSTSAGVSAFVGSFFTLALALLLALVL